jgi:hypothetical protein
MIRAYYTNIAIAGTDDPLIVYIRMAGIGGQDEMTARIKSVGVKYGETYVNDFPLRSELTIDFAIWAENNQELDADDVKAIKAATPKHKTYNLNLFPLSADWD